MMLYRHSALVLNWLPTHPQFKDPASRRAFRSLSKRIDSVISDLERIKPVLDQEYIEWERLSSEATSEAPHLSAASPSYAEFAARDPSLSSSARVLDASEHQELAVDLAQQELARRDKARRASISSHGPEYHAHATARSRDPAFDDGRPDEEDLQGQMEAARRAMALNERAGGDHAGVGDNLARDVDAAQYDYPSIAKSRPLAFQESQRQQLPFPVPGPSRPPKENLDTAGTPDGSVHRSISSHQGPAVPRKVLCDDGAPPVATLPTVATTQPPLPPKRPLDGPPLPKKERLAFKPGAYLENSDPIRSVFVPSKLRSAFLEIASKNTRAGLEMCGILCGTPVNNALFVRCLLIPDQKCTSDTCETENEGAMFDYCASEDLLVLGWIHTHPTQTCFMSSRDLHTQAGYQVMMPESVAIVCAPRFKPE